MVIKSVVELAENQGFTVLKVAYRRGNPIFDASLIAGVDYEENLVPPNALDAEQDQEQEEDHGESDNTDNNEKMMKIQQNQETKLLKYGRKMRKIWRYRMNPIKKSIIKIVTLFRI